MGGVKGTVGSRNLKKTKRLKFYDRDYLCDAQGALG